MDEYEALDAIQALRQEAVLDRLKEEDPRLYDYKNGLIDGLDKAWLAVFQATRRKLVNGA